ncbi:macro domain-containing protein [Streptomyces sp. CA-135486]|uniref:macro domain-containing protein n=1 Tax=Streptomyces sp. CA-135486 TaxID=3240049 RepID=UPI003D90C767
MSSLLLGVTAVLIGAGVALQIWASGPERADRQHALQLPSILLYSLAGALFLFSTFPDSFSEGRSMGFGLGGAAGFAAFFMAASFTWLARTRSRDQLAGELKAAVRENARLRRQLTAGAMPAQTAVPLTRTTRYEFSLPADRRHRLGMITGDLANVLGTDLWVNPENTRMEMSRVTEHTISATIRYHGGRRNALGHLVHDTIALELAECMNGQHQVAAGQVLVTGAGELTDSHQVRRIAHVAAVEGEPASGFRQVMDLGRCVRNVLIAIERLNNAGEDLRSVVLPLLGTGDGNSDPKKTAEALAEAVVDYFRAHPDSGVRAVYLLAYTDVQVAACRAALDPHVNSRNPATG